MNNKNNLGFVEIVDQMGDGQRWARNIQHLMREESGLHRVFDPMGGSRVVEAWTGSLVEAAWAQYEHMKGNMP